MVSSLLFTCIVRLIVWLLFDLRDSDAYDAPTQVAFSREELHATHNRQVKFKDPVSSSEVYGAAAEGQYQDNEDAGTWGSGTPPYSNTLEDPSPSYPYLQPVPEEPSSSFSEGNLLMVSF